MIPRWFKDQRVFVADGPIFVPIIIIRHPFRSIPYQVINPIRAGTFRITPDRSSPTNIQSGHPIIQPANQILIQKIQLLAGDHLLESQNGLLGT
jgi:hypothetical protein